MKNLLLSCVLLGIATTLFSCKGDQGAVGPQGPAGANGVSGLSVANETITMGDWSPAGSSGVYWYYNTTVSTSTSNVIEVYYSYDNSQFWALPGTNVFYGGGVDNLTFNYTAGDNIQLLYYNGDSNAPNSTIHVNIDVIPQTQVAIMKLHGVDLNDYNQVQAYIKLNSK